MAEFERDLASERTAVALASKRDKGQRISRFPPLGYRFKGDNLEPNVREQKAIARIHELRGHGLTVRAVVERLNAERVPCRGKRWHLRTVGKVIEEMAA